MGLTSRHRVLNESQSGAAGLPPLPVQPFSDGSLAHGGIRANSFRDTAGGLDSGAYCLNISLAVARGAHADPREPTDSLL